MIAAAAAAALHKTAAHQLQRVQSPIMTPQIVIFLALLVLSPAIFAAPQVPRLFSRADADARLASVLSARPASAAECVDCEEVLGQVIHQAIGIST